MSLPIRHFPLDISLNNEHLLWIFAPFYGYIVTKGLRFLEKSLKSEFKDFKKEYLILKYITLACVLIVVGIITHVYFESSEMFHESFDTLFLATSVMSNQDIRYNLTSVTVFPFVFSMMCLMAIHVLYKHGIIQILYKILIDRTFREQYRKKPTQ